MSYAILRPPLETCLARAADRAGGELSDPKVIAGLWDDFANLGALEAHVYASDQENAGEVAKALLALLDRGILNV